MTTTWPNSSTQNVHSVIAFHEEETRRLTRVFNAHSRAAIIPADLLSLIFLEQATSLYERRLASWNRADGEVMNTGMQSNASNPNSSGPASNGGAPPEWFGFGDVDDASSMTHTKYCNTVDTRGAVDDTARFVSFPP
ncbi:hypothetical protein L226DRAFT_529105 [Lentinus tigrinus ALCF2SS1-7]|uniref:uncharacterized protein n=1 Tax=Lentinus tigrinus ALCF2SS1-7 TaxID=1328758 RepID=UPI001165E152|nr:hypothetical protein L226DRAFT_529105 [Lentinus tigrinus ALCF2SS1-7]